MVEHFYIGDRQFLHATSVEDDDGAELVGVTHREPPRPAQRSGGPSRGTTVPFDKHASNQKEDERCKVHPLHANVAEADMAGGGSSGHDSTDAGVEVSKAVEREHNAEVDHTLQSGDSSCRAARIKDAEGPEACAGLASLATVGEQGTAWHHHQRDKLQCGDPSGTSPSHDGGRPQVKQARWADMSSESDAEPKKASSEHEELDDRVQAAQTEAPTAAAPQTPLDVTEVKATDEFKPARKRRRERRRVRAKDAATSSAATASTSVDTQVMSTEFVDTQVMSTESHAGEAERNWAHRFLCDALDSVERGDYGAAVAALARLLIPDTESQMPVDQLYTVEQHRVRGGWRATVCIANGRVFTGSDKATPSSAKSDAMEVVIDFLFKFVERTVKGVRGRLDSTEGRLAD